MVTYNIIIKQYGLPSYDNELKCKIVYISAVAISIHEETGCWQNEIAASQNSLLNGCVGPELQHLYSAYWTCNQIQIDANPQ
mgnify:CR=1 FL=1